MAKQPASEAPAETPTEAPGTIPVGTTPLPRKDAEFVFKDMASCPAWVDKNWASYDNGPALALPVNLDGSSPYTTIIAHPGDTVKYVAETPEAAAHFEVIPAETTEAA